jgi:uncharacterized membrane protein YhhN
MTTLARKYWWFLYAGILLADVVCLVLGALKGHFWLKVLLMPILVVALIDGKKTTGQRNWQIILAGLLLAWAGDVLLLFASDTALFFTLGLACFLITHVCYIRYFYKYTKGNRLWLARHPIVSVVLVLYAVVLYSLLLPHLGPLKIPVAVYTLVISLMALQAFAGKPFLPSGAYGWFLCGALLFVASDTILAIDKFKWPMPWAGAALMATYGAAQACFVLGALKNTDLRITN